MSLKIKSLLGLKDISVEDMNKIFDTTDYMSEILKKDIKKTPHMQGKAVFTLFYENSTRTHASFEIAGKYMGANVAKLSVSSSSVAKGETLIDTGATLDVMGADLVIMRHNKAGAPQLLDKNIDAAVINAGDGMNEHPTQALLDIYTMKKHIGDLSGKKIAIVGDILHSRVVRSNIWGLQKLGAEVHIAGPSTLLPMYLDRTGAVVYNRVEPAIEGADVVMALRIQKERQKQGLLPSLREYSQVFGINKERMKLAKEGAMIMHPGPTNRGIELTSELMESANSVIREQVTNGVSIRMALMYLLTRKQSK